MSICNHCSLQLMKKFTKAEEKVSVVHDANWGMGGVNIYRHPKDIDIRKLPGGEDGPRKKYWIAWFMSLPKQCAC